MSNEWENKNNQMKVGGFHRSFLPARSPISFWVCVRPGGRSGGSSDRAQSRRPAFVALWGGGKEEDFGGCCWCWFVWCWCGVVGLGRVG